MANPEILNGAPEEKITIESVEDLKNKLKIGTLPEGELKEFFKDPIKTTRGELMELRKKYLSGEPDIKSVKSFLEQKRNVILEEAKKSVEKFKQTAGFINESDRIRELKNQEGLESGKEADKLIENLNESVSKTGEDVKSKAKNLSKKAKDVAKKGTEAIKSSGIMSSLEKAKENGGLLGFLAGLLLGILKFVGFKSSAEKLKEKLSPEDIKKTKEEISKKLKEEFLPNRDIPEILKVKLNEVINNPELISDENIVELSKKIKSGEKLDILDIKYVLKDKWKEINDSIYKNEETKKALKLELETKIVRSIEQSYGLNFNQQKREVIANLTKKYITKNTDDYLVLNDKLHNKDEMLGAIDVVKFLGTKPIEFINFTIALITENIITPDKVGTQITKAGKVILTMPFNILSSEGITADEYIKKLEGLSEDKRNLFLAILLRKGQALTDILGSMVEFSSRSLLEIASPNIASGAKMGWDTIMLNRQEQIKSFKKIERFLGSNLGEEAINAMKTSVESAKVNTSIIQELDNKTTSVKEKIAKIKNIKGVNENILKSIDNYDDINKLRTFIASNIMYKGNNLDSKIVGYLNSIQHNARGQYIEFSRHMENIIGSQVEAIRGGPERYTNFFKKLKEIIGQSNIARQAKSIKIEAKSTAEVITKMEGLSKLANEFPLLSKSFFGMMPQLAFTVIDYELTPENEKNLMKSLIDTTVFMSGLVGPFLMMISPKIYQDEKGNIEWYNVAEAGIGSILFGIDAAQAIKLGFDKKYKQILTDVVLRPISAPGKFAIHSYRAGKDVLQIVKAEGKINWLKIGEKMSKTIKKGGNIKKAIIFGLLVGGAATVYELSKTDLSDEIENLVDKGIIDKSGNILDPQGYINIYNELDLEEKEAFINLLFATKGTVIPENISIQLINTNNLSIISNNPLIQNKQWFVNGELTSILSDLGIKYENIEFSHEKTKTPA